MKKYEVIIVGAGSAGLMLARELGKLKIKTLLIERKKDILNVPFKTLASFINLKEFELPESVVANKISKGVIYSKRFQCNGVGKLYTLDKVALHKHLLTVIDRNYVTIATSTNISDCIKSPDGSIFYLLDSKNKRHYAKYFVDSTGVAGFLSRQAGLQDKNIDLAVGAEYNVSYKGPADKVYFFIGERFKGGYGWLFPVKNGRAILGFGTFDKITIPKVREVLNSMAKKSKVSHLITIDKEELEGGSIPITSVKSKFVHKNLVCVGDSVSQVNPMVGEGYRFIFDSATMASNAIAGAILNSDSEYLLEYQNKWKEKYHDSYLLSKKLQKKVAQFSSNDLLTDIGVLFLKTKRKSTFIKFFTGEFKLRDVFLP